MRFNIQDTSLVAFKYREYRIFWLAAAFSNIGMWALIFGHTLHFWVQTSHCDFQNTPNL